MSLTMRLKCVDVLLLLLMLLMFTCSSQIGSCDASHPYLASAYQWEIRGLFRSLTPSPTQDYVEERAVCAGDAGKRENR